MMRPAHLAANYGRPTPRGALVKSVALSAVLSLVFAGTNVMSAELKVGDPAPDFTVKDDQGKDWKSSEHYGKNVVVVYFYPADTTGGCTKQACAYRDDLPKLKEAGIEVVGVSGDSVKNHQLFKQKENLNFALLADTDGKVAKAFGVPVTEGEKTVKATVNGKEETLVRTVTAKRWTFIVGKDKKIAYINQSVNAAEDSKTVAEVAKSLK
jgi:peroxiredoxin Q/BCP